MSNIESDDLPDAETARKMAVSNSEIFRIVTSYIDHKIKDAISNGKFSWKSSSDSIDSFVRTKVKYTDDSNRLVEKYVLSLCSVENGISVSEMVKILTPRVRERYESKGYKFEISDDYVLEISFK